MMDFYDKLEEENINEYYEECNKDFLDWLRLQDDDVEDEDIEEMYREYINERFLYE